MRFEYTLHWDHLGRRRPTTAWIDLQGISPDDHITRVIHTRKTFYESDLLEYLALRGPRGGIFIDVGANIGNHSVYFGKFLADYVVSVEPSSQLVPVLKRNLEENAITNQLVLACGVAAQRGVGRVFIPDGAEDNLGRTKIEQVEGDSQPSDTSDLVSLVMLDDIAEQAKAEFRGTQVAFVKIDVEGMELDVLRGGTRLWEDDRPQLSLELKSDAEYAAASSLLAEFGYASVGRFCASPTYYFINTRFHRLRKLPSRLSRSWCSGRLSKIRQMFDMR